LDPLVSIIIPTLDRKVDLLECLNSVFQSELPPHEVIVVDNGCSDGTSLAVATAFPTTRIVRSSRNLGVSGGRNLGASISAGELLLFLDHDTKVEVSAVAKLAATVAADTSIGVAGAAILRYDKPNLVWAFGTSIDLLTGRNKFLDSDSQYSPNFPIAIDVPIVPTAFMVSRKVFELAGGFDNEFFAVYEDSDFCFRVKRLGYKIVCVTHALVWNKVERPSSVPPQLRILGLENTFRAFFIGRNRILFMKRHSGPLGFIGFTLLFLPVYLLYFSIACSRNHRWDILRAFLTGTATGLRKNLPKVVRWNENFARC
jgi:GT2 family glycosyltransferase